MAGCARIGLLVAGAVLLLTAGCGGVIGQLDEFPEVPVPESTPWPRLVDTPEAPETRLTAGAGQVALTDLSRTRESVQARGVAAAAVSPVPETLAAQVTAAEQRRANSRPPVDEALLLARAQQSREREATPRTAVEPSSPTAARIRADAPSVSPEFERAAQRALERAARARNARP